MSYIVQRRGPDGWLEEEEDVHCFHSASLCSLEVTTEFPHAQRSMLDVHVLFQRHPFATSQGGSFGFGLVLFWIGCAVEPRDDGVPFQRVVPGSFCVHTRFVDVIAIPSVCNGFELDLSIWMRCVRNAFEHCLFPMSFRMSVQLLVKTGAVRRFQFCPTRVHRGRVRTSYTPPSAARPSLRESPSSDALFHESCKGMPVIPDGGSSCWWVFFFWSGILHCSVHAQALLPTVGPVYRCRHCVDKPGCDTWLFVLASRCERYQFVQGGPNISPTHPTNQWQLATLGKFGRSSIDPISTNKFLSFSNNHVERLLLCGGALATSSGRVWNHSNWAWTCGSRALWEFQTLVWYVVSTPSRSDKLAAWAKNCSFEHVV